MNEAIASMMARYNCQTTLEYTNAHREIMQDVALLGLWRSKFFEKAVFYGGTALRALYGLDRYSEDMDFSLLEATPDFNLGAYGQALEKELSSFGFSVQIQNKNKARSSPIQSAFLKANTHRELLVITSDENVTRNIHRGSVLKIKLEVDTDPPGGFSTESKFLLQPIPFSVRTMTSPCLFAGKMHAVLCRQWKTRVKGRDWYDMIWYVANATRLDLGHLEKRMHQSGHLSADTELTPRFFQERLEEKIENLDIQQACSDVEPFVKDIRAMDVWSREFFHDVRSRIKYAL